MIFSQKMVKNWKPEKPKTKRKKRPEASLQDAAVKYLLLKKWLVIRLNSGVMRSEATQMPFRSYIISNTGTSAGAPDLLAWKGGFSLLIELKSAKGRQTDSQRKFQALCAEHGVYYTVCRELNELIEVEKSVTKKD